MYNPWSILNYLTDRVLMPYWVNTSSNDLIKLILKNSATVKQKMEQLLKDEEIEVKVEQETIITGIEKDEDNIWGLLIGTGYLRITQVVDLLKKIYMVKLPNMEIKCLFEEIIDVAKENAEEKAENEKKQKELVSNISHDLKTPITSIKGYVEGIMDGVAKKKKKMDKYIKTVYNKANDMDKLINELTLYSGIDNNRIPYHFHRINVADYFGDCVEEVGLDLESKNIELNYSNLAAPDTMIIADPEQMKKVINNIIGNSIKYMDKEKGVIDIRILDEVDSIRIEIEDNGKGIAAKDLPKIFERFYRTDTSRNSSKGGSGIGLSIVHKIMEDHGGKVWVTSREDAGTTMYFVLRKYQEVPVSE